MFNKELFLTHIKNAPVPEELGEPLVEMKKKSDIDTIADIMGTSNEPRPLQEQYGRASFGSPEAPFMPSITPPSPEAPFQPVPTPQRNDMMARINRRKQREADAKTGQQGIDQLKLGFDKFKNYMSDTATGYGAAKRKVAKQMAYNTRENEKIAADSEARRMGPTRRDFFMGRQNDPDVSRFDKVKDRADYFKRTSNMDLGRVGNQRRADLAASNTTELEKRQRLADTGYDPNREDYDDPIVQLGAHAVQAGRERRAEKKSYGVRPKTGDYRLPGGGYDYAAMKADMKARGEIA